MFFRYLNVFIHSTFISNMNLLNHTLIKKLEFPMSSAVSYLLSRKMGCLQRKYRDHPPCLVMDGCSAGKVILCSLDSPAQVHEKDFLGCQKILQTFNNKTKRKYQNVQYKNVR